MSEDGYSDVAGAMSAFLNLVVMSKENSFKKRKLDFSQVNVNGDLIDACSDDEL